MSAQSILIVEDETVQAEALKTHLEDAGYLVTVAATAREGLDAVSRKTIDVVISDYNLPDKDGDALLKDIKALNPEIPVIIVTAYGSIDRAVDTMKSGAVDFIAKPVNIDELLLKLKKACDHRLLIAENTRLRNALQERFTARGVIAASGKMQEDMNITGRVASSKASVLILGESGTGKEVIARMIHYASPRKDAPFVAFNVAALSPSLIENELFGHEKGAFTGADRTRDGRFVQANTGTIFIDEIGDIPPESQAKFLRVLQENAVERLGSSKTIPIDIRIIAATNKDLDHMIANGTFREDLYYRLNVVTISIPPLRKRKEDILPLSDLFITRFSTENKKAVEGFTKDAFDVLLKYHFPGNVRELENIIERAVVLARGSRITLEDLPTNIFAKAEPEQLVAESGLNARVEELEKQLIVTALRKAGGNQSQAARSLNISERKLRYKLGKYGFP